MDLTVTQHEARWIDGRIGWTPFGPSDGFTDRWWNRHLMSPSDNDLWLSFTDGGVEVARAQLELRSQAGTSYGVQPPPGGYVEIEFLEVRADRRRSGVGSAVVTGIGEMFPDAHLAAFSEAADDFWSTLGWGAHVKRTRGPAYRTLYISGLRPPV